MKKYLLIILILITTINAQTPKVDLTFRNKQSKQKNRVQTLYKKAMAEITENQTKYDVRYYDISLTVNTRNEKIYGNVKVIGEIIAESLESIELNFWNGMTITNIYPSNDQNKELSFIHENDILTVNLDSTLATGEQFSINIEYEGSPGNNPYGYFRFELRNELPLVWTLNEPIGARAWIPCKDTPSDKADSVDLRISVPTGLTVASNGLLREKTTSGNNTIFWWHEGYPIATYLISLAIYPYLEFSDWYIFGDNDSMEVQYFVFPSNYNRRVVDYSKTVEMITYLSETFGQYPFVKEKYGHVEFSWGGGMEHQTLTSLGGASESLIIHELAHQWWGDAITCNSFHDLWLNEGFASYTEALWFEHEYYGYSASDYQLNAEYFGNGKIYIEDVENENLFHSGLRYDKASWVLHMLRKVVGEESFFEILRSYYASQEFLYASATTEQFIEICENISGMKLDKFFQQWIFGEYYPVYSYTWSTEKLATGTKINLTIFQEQTNAGPFWMPIDVQISSLQTDTIVTVMDSLKIQTFEIYVDNSMKFINLDPNNWILKKIQENDSSISEEQNALEYKLYQNFPNPFNPTTKIAFNLSKNSDVNLSVYNLRGKKVRTIVEGWLRAGFYRVDFDGQNLPSGVYFYELETMDFRKGRKMLLVK